MCNERIARTFNLDQDVVDALEKASPYRGDKTRHINEALRAYFKIKPKEAIECP